MIYLLILFNKITFQLIFIVIAYHINIKFPQLELSAHVSLSEDWMSLIELDESSNSFAANSIRPTLHNISYSGVAYDSLMCGGNCTCPQGCTVHCDTEKLVDNFKPVDFQNKKTFGLYLALRIPAQFFLASAFTMMVCIVNKSKLCSILY